MLQNSRRSLRVEHFTQHEWLYGLQKHYMRVLMKIDITFKLTSLNIHQKLKRILKFIKYSGANIFLRL